MYFNQQFVVNNHYSNICSSYITSIIFLVLLQLLPDTDTEVVSKDNSIAGNSFNITQKITCLNLRCDDIKNLYYMYI